MSSADNNQSILEEARREIDALDEGLLNLLEMRFDCVARVRAAKGGNGQGTPVRPEREAFILRRLLARAVQGSVPPDLVVRLWRAIMAEASLAQAPITLHVSRRFAQTAGNRLRLRDYFGTMAVEDYRDEAQALYQIEANPTDLCVVETEAPWIEPFLEGKAGRAQVIAVLPFLKTEAMPRLLVLGHARAVATGEDETLIISDGKLPRDFTPAPRWEAKVGPRRLSSLPGFLSEHESPLVSLMRSNPGLHLRVAGRYPSPFEVV
ncbi:MAG TPA: chorismate mutase [Aestuariivirga sp.]|nr:chorismate mutase [Aestuariivirga sp.]